MELKWRIWFEKDGRRVIGKGGANILKAIRDHGSISKASRALGMSYRFVWSYLNEIERAIGGRVVEKERGGSDKGGTKLTKLGLELLRRYEKAERLIDGVLNRAISGEVVEVEDGRVVIELDSDCDLRKGDRVVVLREDL